jgi:hypothetical protein
MSPSKRGNLSLLSILISPTSFSFSTTSITLITLTTFITLITSSRPTLVALVFSHSRPPLDSLVVTLSERRGERINQRINQKLQPSGFFMTSEPLHGLRAHLDCRRASRRLGTSSDFSPRSSIRPVTCLVASLTVTCLGLLID